MSVDRDTVRRIAELARLELSDEELTRYTSQLANILGHIGQLGEVTGEPAQESAAERAAPLRPDEPGADPLQRTPAELAPDWRDGFFVVPRLSAQERPPSEAVETPKPRRGGGK